MIEYVIPENPDNRILSKCSEQLNSGSLIAFPTDTNWIIACDPWSKTGVEALYRFKGESKQKHFAFLCPSIAMASEVGVVTDSAYRLIRNRVPGNYTFIFKATKLAMKAVKASKTDHEVEIRIPPNSVVLKLLEYHRKPILSTNLTKEMLGIGEDDAVYSFMIEEKFGHSLSSILDPGEYEFAGASTIVDFSQGDFPILVREGAGEVFC